MSLILGSETLESPCIAVTLLKREAGCLPESSQYERQQAKIGRLCALFQTYLKKLVFVHRTIQETKQHDMNTKRQVFMQANFCLSPFPGSFILTNSCHLRWILYCYFIFYWCKYFFRYRGVLLWIPVPQTPFNRILNACAFNAITRLLNMPMLLHVTSAATTAWTYLSSALEHHIRHKHCLWFACSPATVSQLRTYYYR
jgi:hypothetical protein